MNRMIGWSAKLISAIGAMNWGLVVFFKFDLVQYVSIMVRMRQVSNILYGIIALSGVYVFISLFAFNR